MADLHPVGSYSVNGLGYHELYKCCLDGMLVHCVGISPLCRHLRRQRGRVVRASDLKFAGRRFKSRSDH